MPVAWRKNDWIPIKVETIIDPGLFKMAQVVRDKRDPKKNPGRTAYSPALLAGLLRRKMRQQLHPRNQRQADSRWLPRHASSMNFDSYFIIYLEKDRKRLDSERLRKPGRPRILDTLDRAEQFRQALDTGVVNKPSDLAHYYGLSRARVSQLLSLLKLHPVIIEYVRWVAVEQPTKAISERRLRPLVHLEHRDQLTIAAESFPRLGDLLAPSAPSANVG